MTNYNFTTNLECKENEIEDVWCVSFGDMMSQIGGGIIIQPLISFLEHAAIAKTFAKREPQYQIDTTQELVAFGSSNIVNSMIFGVVPTSSVISRTSVMFSAGKSMLATWLTSGYDS